MKLIPRSLALLAVALLTSLSHLALADAMGTAFTYQGRLADGANPATGTYDFRFAVFDSPDGAGQLGPAQTNAVDVANGLFSVALDFGPDVFSGEARWLDLAVRTNASGAFTPLSPRQPLSPNPYALYASNAGWSATAGRAASVAANSVANANLQADAVTSAKIADGTIAAADLSPALASGAFWRLDGNAETGSGYRFLGTTDNRPLEFRVNGKTAWRLEPTANDMPNVIGGIDLNSVGPGVYGATIGGGGARLGGDRRNSVASSLTTIAGGAMNTIETNCQSASIGGGWANSIRGASSLATIAGGYFNVITNSSVGWIGGGSQNRVASQASAIAGGAGNQILSGGLGFGLIGGGWENTVQGAYSVIVGGDHNATAEGAEWSAIGGGAANVILGSYAAIPGGDRNAATNYAFAAGRRAKAVYQGSFVWADSTDADFASTAADQFAVRARGGMRFDTSILALSSDSDFVTGLDLYNTTSPYGQTGYRLQVTGSTEPARAGNFEIWRAGTGEHLLTIDTSGNLGIGTTSPQARLDVVGDANIDGRLRWRPKTSYVAVSAAAFNPGRNGTVFTNDGRWVKPAGSPATFYAAVQLPHGATVTRLTWIGANPLEGASGQLALCRATLGGAKTVMAVLSANRDGSQMSTSLIAHASVDNATYTYYLEMILSGAIGSGAIIEYSVAEPY